MTISGGAEVMVLAATLEFQEGSTIFSFDGASAFNNIERHRIPPAQAEVIPVATNYATNVYARDPTKALFVVGGHTNEVIPFARRIEYN